MEGKVIALSDINNLKEELNELNQEYLFLFEKLEDLKKDREYYENLYMNRLGSLIYMKLEKEIEYRRLKMKLALIIKNKNKGEEVNINDIDKILQKELIDFYKELNNMSHKLKESQEFFKCPTLSYEEKMELWLKVKEAYENNDLVTLIILYKRVN